jgi:hypothetical protein
MLCPDCKKTFPEEDMEQHKKAHKSGMSYSEFYDKRDQPNGWAFAER